MTTISAMPDNDSTPDAVDIRLDADGNLAVASEAESVRQRAIERLRFWEAEWFLTPQDGMPYLATVFRYRVPTPIVEQLIVNEVQRVAGVQSITSSSIRSDTETRRLYISLRGVTDYGELVIDNLAVG